MTKSYLTSVSSARSKFPKKLLLWNYWDHEHIVGTHFKHYKKVNILYENDKCCYSERWSKIPYFPFYIKITDLLVLADENQFEVFHSVFFNLIKGVNEYEKAVSHSIIEFHPLFCGDTCTW